MSSKSVVVPSYFTAAQAERCPFLHRLHHIAKKEAERLEKAGEIVRLTPKIYRFSGSSLTYDYEHTGAGNLARHTRRVLLSSQGGGRQITLFDWMRNEMAGRPSWALDGA